MILEIKQLLNLLILFFTLKQTRWQIKGKRWRKEYVNTIILLDLW